MTGIETEVRRNRRQTTRLEGYQREVAPDQTEPLAAPVGTISVDVTGSIQTRPINDSLIVGHPDEQNGVDRGVVGDQRGSWSEVATASGEFVADGRNALARSLDGQAVGIDRAVVGTDATTPSTADAALGNKTGSAPAWGETPVSDTLRGVADFRFDAFGDVVEELGLLDPDGNLLCRLTADSTVDPAVDEELRVVVDLTFSHSAATSAAVTDMATIAHSLQSEARVRGLAELGLGTDGTDPTTSDTALGGSVIQKTAGRDVGRDRITPFTIVLPDEPGTQPHDIREMGVYNGDGDLVWRVTFPALEKDDRIRLRPSSPLNID